MRGMEGELKEEGKEEYWEGREKEIKIGTRGWQARRRESEKRGGWGD